VLDLKNKITITSPLILDKITKKEYDKYKSYASTVDFPLEKQRDLSYFKAVFLSAGTNKNSITFLPSELVKARGTISHKAVDLEHAEDTIVGHIYAYSFVFPDGKEFDPDQLLAEMNNDLEKIDALDMDIVVAGVLYRHRFPELAQELDKKEWFISMEAFYKDFSVKVGNTILPRDVALSLGLTESSIGKHVNAKFEKGSREYHRSLVSKVIRNILFSGAGLVKDPANPNSVFIETASTSEEVVVPNDDLTIDLTSYSNSDNNNDKSMSGGDDAVDSLDKNKTVAMKVAERYESRTRFLVISVDGEGKGAKYKVIDSFTDWTSASKAIMSLLATNTGSKYTVVGYCQLFSDLDKNITLEEITKDSNVSRVFELNEDGEIISIFRVVTDNMLQDMGATFLTSPTIPVTWTVPNPVSENQTYRRTITEGLCVNFKKYVYEYNGAADQGKIVKEHWCTLFDGMCTVTGALAKDAKCLRNVKNRTTKDEVDNNMFGDNPEAASSDADIVVVENVTPLIASLTAAIDRASAVLDKLGVKGAKWKSKTKNDLPDSSFAYVERDVKSNACRHLPHHNSKGGGTANINLDLPHLRNALARVNQVKPVGKISKEALVKKSLIHLNKHRSALKTAKSSENADTSLIGEIESLYAQKNREIFGK
jgi:hypothetical protein